MRDANGDELPPLWRPTKLHASDVVDTGDAVDDFMSAELGALDIDQLPDALVRRGSELLNKAFPGQTREVVEARLNAWLSKYLDLRYGPDYKPTYEQRKRKLRLLELTTR